MLGPVPVHDLRTIHLPIEPEGHGSMLKNQQTKLYPWAIRGKTSEITLTHSNEFRNWRIYADLGHSLIVISMRYLTSFPFKPDLPGTLKFDRN